MIGSVLVLIFSVFPAPFAVFLLGTVAIFVIICVFKLVKLVLDAIPFL